MKEEIQEPNSLKIVQEIPKPILIKEDENSEELFRVVGNFFNIVNEISDSELETTQETFLEDAENQGSSKNDKMAKEET